MFAILSPLHPIFMKFSLLRAFRLENFLTIFARFPLSVLSAAVATGSAIWLTTNSGELPSQGVERLLAMCMVGILFFTGLALFAEQKKLRSALIQLLGLPVLYLLIYRVDPSHNDMFLLRNALVFLAALALIFVGPFFSRRDNKSFWPFFIKVWTRALFAIATAGIVVLALNLALYSVSVLFDVFITDRWHQYVFAVFLIFVPNLVFLMGLPKNDKEALDHADPTAFRALGNFLFSPLLLVYFLILAAYVVKILFTQVWPSGFVAMPILIFSMIGFGLYALSSPLLGEKSSRFLTLVNRAFLRSLPVFVLVYFVAFWQRIAQYGVTEDRYLGVALGALLFAWALYFGWSKKPQLKVIPLGLFVVPLLVSFGPWGVFQVSIRSQVDRLETVLQEQGLLNDGVVTPSSNDAVGFAARQRISSILDYLLNRYGPEPVLFLFKDPEALKDAGVVELMSEMGISYENEYDTTPLDGGEDYYFTVSDFDPQMVSGYDYLIRYSFYDWGTDNTQTITVAGKELSAHFNTLTSALELSGAGETLSVPLTTFLTTLETEHPEEGPLNREVFSLTAENSSLTVKIYFNSLAYHRVDEERNDLTGDMEFLLRLK